MRRSLVLLCALLLATTGTTAFANELPTGDYGGGSTRAWVNRPIYDGGNPNNGKFTSCRVRIKGPYVEGDKDEVIVGKGRLECQDSSDLYLSNMLLRVMNNEKAYGGSREDQCGYAGDKITKRVAADGSVWWGCTFKKRVTDKAPLRSENWYVSFYGEINVADPTDSGPLSYTSVISYCRGHEGWCANNPRKVAIRENFF